MADYYENRARELLLTPEDRAAYLRLMTEGSRTEYQVICPACFMHVETFETDILRHVRWCTKLKEGRDPT